jgi:hypothetical protein
VLVAVLVLVQVVVEVQALLVVLAEGLAVRLEQAVRELHHL